MLSKKNRLTKKKDFETVFKKGKSFKEGFLILKLVFSKTKDCRVGIVVSRKISKKATVRNKIKRRIRAAVKSQMPKVKKGMDAVLFAQPGLKTKNFQEIEETIKKLFKKAEIINNV